MNQLWSILSSHWIDRLGWTLVHSLWQVALVGIVAAILLGWSYRRSPNLRYTIACLALAAMCLSPLVTWCSVPQASGAAAPFSAPATATPPQPASPPGTVSMIDVDRGAPAGVSREPSPTDLDASRLTALRGLTSLLTPWVPWTVLVWLAGVTLLSIRRIGGLRAVGRLRHAGVLPVSESLADRFAAIASRLAVTRPVRLMQSILVEVPVTIGWLRPVVLVPASVLTGLAPCEIEAVLAHELAHVRRCDYFVNLLQTVAETLLFYHPAVWWISRRIRIEREHCCDDVALAVCQSRIDYAKALLAMEKNRTAPEWAMAAAGTKKAGTLLVRVQRVLGVPAPGRRRVGDWVGAAILLALGTAAMAIPFGLGADPAKAVEPSADKPAAAGAKPGLTPLAPSPSSAGGKPKIVAYMGSGSSFRFARGTSGRTILLTGYDLLMQPSVVKMLDLTQEQADKLNRLQSDYQSQLMDFFRQRRDLPQDDEQKALRPWLSEQLGKIRGRVAEILTPTQTALLDEFSRQTLAYRYLSRPDSKPVAALGLAAEQHERLNSLQNEAVRQAWDHRQRQIDAMLAVLTARQRDRLQQEFLGPEWPASGCHVAIEVGEDGWKIYVPDLTPYPDFTREEVRSRLQLSPQQHNQLRKMIGEASDLAAKFVEQWQSLPLAEREKRRELATSGSGGSAAGSFRSDEERKKWEAELMAKERKARREQWAERRQDLLVKANAQLVEQFEAILTPAQRTYYRDMAFRNSVEEALIDQVILRKIGATDRQIDSLGLLFDESIEWYHQFARQTGKEMLQILTPAQQEKLRRESSEGGS